MEAAAQLTYSDETRSVLERQLVLGASVSESEPTLGRNALHMAAFSNTLGFAELVRLVSERRQDGFDVVRAALGKRDGRSCTPLHYLSRCATDEALSSTDVLGMVRKLLRQRAPAMSLSGKGSDVVDCPVVKLVEV